MTTASVTINAHGTPDALYDALARVFPESRNEGSRWVTVNADGVTLTFFGSRESNDPEAALTDNRYDLAETVA